MPVEIRETIVTPVQNGDVVQLYISDAERGDESASFVLQLSAQLPKPGSPALLAQLQQRALQAAREHMSSVLQGLAQQVQEGS